MNTLGNNDISPEEAAFHAAEHARGDLAYCPDTLPCYFCHKSGHVNTRQENVVKLGPVINTNDPTQTYILACGHTAF